MVATSLRILVYSLSKSILFVIFIKREIKLYQVIREITNEYDILLSIVLINFLPHLQHYLLNLAKKRQNRIFTILPIRTAENSNL